MCFGRGVGCEGVRDSVFINGGSIRVKIHHNFMEEKKTYKQMKLWTELHDRIKMLAAQNGQSINEYLDQLTEGEEKQ